jgi:hypothetical protein
MSFVRPQAALYELAAGVVLADGRIIVAKPSAQVFGAVTISSARLAAACPVSAVTGFRRFEIVA